MLKVSYAEAFKDNYIWLLHTPDDSARAVAVDPGDAAPVERWLAGNDAILAGILVTHHHHDHVGGVEDLVAAHACPVWGPAREHIPCRDHALADGDTVAFEGLRFTVLDIPGHTAGHIAYHGHDAVFAGDTLFAAGCGRMFEGTPEQMQASLARLAALPPDTRLYCGHEYTLDNLRFARAVEPGNAGIERREREARAARECGEPTLPSRIADETATNPFLRWAEPAVIEAAGAHAGTRPGTPVEVFATVRHWKDGFS